MPFDGDPVRPSEPASTYVPPMPPESELTDMPFNFGVDPDDVMVEARAVANALREMFGLCDRGDTDLHLLTKGVTPAKDEAVTVLICAKCMRSFPWRAA